MAQDNEPRSAGGSDSIDEWIEREPRTRTPQPRAERAIPDPQIVQELEQLYRDEAQAVDRRLERVWHRLEQHSTTQQTRQEPASQTLSVFPLKRRVRSMKNPLSLFPAPRQWSARVSALAAAILLIVLVGGLTAGLILVRHGNSTSTQATKTPTALATPSPTPTPTPATSGNLTISSITMKDATTGWATGYPNPLPENIQTQILHTTDGGVHWKNVTPHASALLSQASHTALQPLSDGAAVRTEDFVTNSVAWVLILPNHFFKTTDGGQTWQPETAPGESMRQFTFLDENNGWVITEDGGVVVVFRTTDGGVTWTKMQKGGSAAFPLLDRFWGVRFLNETTGWAVYINNNVGRTATMYVTHDSGATWQHQQILMPAGVIPPVFSNSPVFFNNKEGMMEVYFNGVGSQFHPDTTLQPASGGAPEGLYVTHNGGTTWEGPIILQGLQFPNFIDVSHGWALNSTASGLLTTSDSGRNWATIPTDSTFEEINSINFISSQIGWALKYASDGSTIILRTDDGGQVWTPLNLNISN